MIRDGSAYQRVARDFVGYDREQDPVNLSICPLSGRGPPLMMRSSATPVNWPSNRAIRCLIKFPKERGTPFFHGAMERRVCWKLLGKKLVALALRVGSTCKEILDFLEYGE